MIDRLNVALEGRYHVERELGQGGMATVYLAEDLKHDRRVAIKVLKPELAAVIGAERFISEIKTTASLQHPHILPLFDSGEAAGFLYYVMPFVDGESLRDRLDRERQLGVNDTVGLAGAVASALQYAHDRGIVHRDIKPENVLIHAGQPVVADFGIALALSAAGGGRLTETGLSLGTPHYMSPEQATADRDVTARSDLYSLACVVYEMLTGDPPHTGPTAQAILMRILTEDPRPVTDVRRTVPRHVQGALAKALEKLPADRFESAEEFAEALRDPSFEYVPVRRASASPGATSAGPAGADRPMSLAGWLSDGRSVAILGVAALLAGGWALTTLGGGDAPDRVAASRVLPAYRFEIAGQGDTEGEAVDISLDGAIIWPGGGPGAALRVRFPGEPRVRELPGTEGGFHPSFSPDGEWVVFSVETELRKVPTRGGPVVSVARTEEPPLLFPHWGPEGMIALSKSDGLYRVPAVGGTPELVLQVPGQFGARLPFILPDGAGWLFTLVGGGLGGGESDLMLLDPGTGETSLLAEGGSGGVWLPTGHVAFTHASGSLFAGPFDLAAGRFTSPPAPVLDSVVPGLFGRSFAASGSGGAVYLSGDAGPAGGALAQVVFMSPAGGDPQLPPIDRTDHTDGRFSPDGRRLAYTFDDHIWIYDLELGSKPRFTTEGSNHHDPVWSPDGTRIAFGSERDSLGVDVWVQEVDGDSPARLVFQLPGPQFPREWTAEGLVVQTSSQAGPGGNTDVYIVPVDGDGGPRPYLRADWSESLARVSPDGRWLAYQSGDTEPASIAVRAFPEPGRAFRISRPEDGFAANPVWSPEGSTIYYTHPATRKAMAAEVRTDPAFEVVSRREIGTVTGELRDAHPDGGYLLTFQFGDLGSSGSPARLIVVGNWLSELVSRLGERRVR